MASVSVNCSTMNFLRGATELLSGALKSECAPPPRKHKNSHADLHKNKN